MHFLEIFPFFHYLLAKILHASTLLLVSYLFYLYFVQSKQFAELLLEFDKVLGLDLENSKKYVDKKNEIELILMSISSTLYTIKVSSSFFALTFSTLSLNISSNFESKTKG